jgi:uncharacterized membrane protein
MLESARGAALLVATLASGLIAGLFYAYACSVMPGLHGADDRTVVEAMQRIHVAILNGWFFATFLGAPLLIVLAGILHLVGGGGARTLPWIVAGFVGIAVMWVITVTVNVPLNDALVAAGAPERAVDLPAVRAAFEATWVHWNIARAVAGTAGFGCLLWALVQYGRATG